jgi:hypothetical protein
MFGFAECVTIRRPVGQMFNIAANPETRTTDLGLGRARNGRRRSWMNRDEYQAVSLRARVWADRSMSAICSCP